MADEVRAGEVDGDDPVPLVVADEVDRPATGHAGGVHDAVEPAGRRGFDRRGHDVADRAVVGDVADDGDPALPHLVAERVADGVGAGEVGTDDRGALGEEPPGRGLADARGGAGDDDRAVVKRSMATPSMFDDPLRPPGSLAHDGTTC